MTENNQLRLKATVDNKEIEISIDYADLDKYFEHYYNYRLSKNMQANVISSSELLRKAAEIFVKTGKCSTSILQRNLRIGYGRAASIIETLEDKGVVGPALGGSKPREVLISSMDEYKG